MCYANKIQQTHKELENNPLKMEMFQKGWFLREELRILHLKLENHEHANPYSARNLASIVH